MRRDAEGRPFTTAPRGDYTDESIARLESEGRVHRTASGKVYVKYFLVKRRGRGVVLASAASTRSGRTCPRFGTRAPGSERGFRRRSRGRSSTASSRARRPQGGLVVDVFGGSGTTGESAHALGRRFVLGDASPLALGIARARLLRADASFVVERCGPPRAVEAQDPELEVRVSGHEGRTRVELVAPLEPLAWAIDVAHDPSRPFHTTWHSERDAGSPGPGRHSRGDRRPGRGADRGARLARRRPSRARRRWQAVILRDPVHGLVAFEGDEEADRRSASSTRPRCSACVACASSG